MIELPLLETLAQTLVQCNEQDASIPQVHLEAPPQCIVQPDIVLSAILMLEVPDFDLALWRQAVEAASAPMSTQSAA